MIGVGLGATPFEATADGHRLEEGGQGLAEGAVPIKGLGQEAGMLGHDPAGFDQAVGGHVPAAEDHQPVGQDEPNQLGVELTLDAQGFAGAPGVELAQTLPALEWT